MNFQELHDEQLAEVVGGNATNYSNQVNEAFAPTVNTVAFARDVRQSGSTIYQSNTVYQSAIDFTRVFIH